MAGPHRSIKKKYAAIDQSHLIEESWLGIFRNSILVLLIAITVWALCSGLRYAVEESNALLFHPLEHPASSLNAPSIHKKSAAKKTTSTYWPISEESAPLFLLLVITGVGVIRGLLLKHGSWSMVDGDGAGQAIKYFHQTYDGNHAETEIMQRYKAPTFKRAIQRIIVTILTLGAGGSGGLEGPVIPIGENLGAGWAKLFRIPCSYDLRAMQMAGIAAAIATLLNAPFTAAIFAAEVVYTDRFVYRTLIYSLLAAIVVYIMNTHLSHMSPLFMIDKHSHVYTLKEYCEVILVSIFVCAPAGFGVKIVFNRLRILFNHIPLVLRAPVGAMCAAGIALLLWYTLHISPNNVLGMGEETLRNVLQNTSGPLLTVWWVLLLLVFTKMFATGFTLMSGGSAGLLVPAMFMGGMSGAAVYYALVQLGFAVSLNTPSLYMIAGIASSLVVVIEVPLAAIIFIMEVFGTSYGPPAIVSVIICHTLAKRLNLYR